LEGISLHELSRMHDRLREEHDELYKYSHNVGHDVINLLTVVPDMREILKIHTLQIDNLRKFMWITIGAMGVVNVLLPVISRIQAILK
jgi:hypothetical protein